MGPTEDFTGEPEGNMHNWAKLMARLGTKYAQTGQDLEAYLEGLLYQDYLNYWDYIHTDALLAMQIPRTQFPDEMIFIIYHQISELNFKMILSELAQVADAPDNDAAMILTRVRRINRYVDGLVQSFSVMSDGMDPKQFMRFRMALLPASGFQSAQFRMIEIASTDFFNLVNPAARNGEAITDAGALYEQAYWRAGATELHSGQKTLTLRRFEEKYGPELQAMIAAYATKNLWRRSQQALTTAEPELADKLREALRDYDHNINVAWRLVHYKSASRYLKREPTDAPATGGTNWQQYLPPGFQRNFFFPDLWTEEERAGWGGQAVAANS